METRAYQSTVWYQARPLDHGHSDHPAQTETDEWEWYLYPYSHAGNRELAFHEKDFEPERKLAIKFS